jgi:hypothetical protein
MRWEDDREWWIGKVLQGRDRGLFQGTASEFFIEDWRKSQRNPQDTPAEIGTRYLPN